MSWRDPSTGQTYSIPRFTSTQTWIDPQQELRKTRTRPGRLGQIGLQQPTSIGGMRARRSIRLNAQACATEPSSPASCGQHGSARCSRGPALSDAVQAERGRAGGRQRQRHHGRRRRPRPRYDPGGQIQTEFGDAGDITHSYGAGDFSQDRQSVEDALMARINPQLAKERGNIEQRLADQGIRYGSPGLHVGDGRLQPAGHRHAVWRHRPGRRKSSSA